MTIELAIRRLRKIRPGRLAVWHCVALCLLAHGLGACASYEGRDAAAAWRKGAAERIEKIRKADLTVSVTDGEGKPLPAASVSVEMERHAFGFGSAVAAKMLCDTSADGKRYREIVERNYNKVVFENDLKWEPWNVSKSNENRGYRKEWTDRSFAWLGERRIEVRGHYVSWAPLTARQMQKYGGRPRVLRSDLFAHIEDKLPAVGERVGEWDAVNHIVGWGETLSSVLGGDAIYVDVIKRSRKLAPHAQLWINEGQVLPSGKKIDSYERMARYVIAEGAPLDGIGFMGHFAASTLTPPDELLRVFDKFSKVVPTLQITEFDVNVGGDERLQADYLRDVMTMAFSHPAMEAVVMWGFWEGRHWRPDAALYRRDWSIKPAGQVWRGLVFDEWWSREKGKTGADGTFEARVFRGEYAIAVRHGGIVKTVKATVGEKTKVSVVLR